MRPVFYLNLLRHTRHVAPQVSQVTGKLIVESAVLALLCYLIAVLVLT